jgi:hypothetical protein
MEPYGSGMDGSDEEKEVGATFFFVLNIRNHGNKNQRRV